MYLSRRDERYVENKDFEKQFPKSEVFVNGIETFNEEKCESNNCASNILSRAQNNKKSKQVITKLLRKKFSHFFIRMDKIQILLFKLPSATNRTRSPRQIEIRSRGHSCVWWNNRANIRALGLTQMEITTPEHDSLRLLFHYFHGNRYHRWRQGGLNDRYSVYSVVLMSLHKRLHIIWWDQTNDLTCFFRLTAPSGWRQRYRLLSWYFPSLAP